MNEENMLILHDNSWGDSDNLILYVLTRPLSREEHFEVDESFRSYRRTDPEWNVDEIIERVTNKLKKMGVLVNEIAINHIPMICVDE